MTNFYVNAAFILLLSVAIPTKAQEVEVVGKDSIFSTSISAVTGTKIFTKHGKISLKDITEIKFPAYDDKYANVYQKLRNKVKVKMGDVYACNYINVIPLDEHGQFSFKEKIVLNASQNDFFFAAQQYFADLFKADDFSMLKNGEKDSTFLLKAVKQIDITENPSMIYTFEVTIAEGYYSFDIYNIRYRTHLGETLFPCDLFTESTYYKKEGKINKINEAYRLETVKYLEPMISKFKNFMANSIPEFAMSDK